MSAACEQRRRQPEHGPHGQHRDVLARAGPVEEAGAAQEVRAGTRR